MGGVWSFFQDDKQLFNKSVHLRYPSDSDSDSYHGSNGSGDAGYSSKSAFYQTLKQAVARMELMRARQSSLTGGAGGAARDDGDMEPDDRAHVNFMLAHWPREVDVVYDRHDEFPFTIAIERELDTDILVAPPATQHGSAVTSERSLQHQQPNQIDCSAVASQEEAILKGLCENKLSSSEAIHQAIEQLRSKLGSDMDQFLRVLAKYPRAVRLFANQQLHARSDVELAFRLHMLHRDYARAAYTIGKLAYGEEASQAERKLQRLRGMSSLLQRSLASPSAERQRSSSSDISRSQSASARVREARGSTRAATSFDQVMTDEATALLQYQSSLQTTLDVEYLVGSSLIETLHKLFALYPTHPAAFSMAVMLAEQFEVHPRQFSWALLKVLAQTEQWQTLLMVTAAARPAIGYVPVVELLLDEDHDDLAQDLLALIDAPREREEIMALLAAFHTHKSGTSADEQATDARRSSTNTIEDSSYYMVGTNEGG